MTLRSSSLALACACAVAACDSGAGGWDDGRRVPSDAQAVTLGSTTVGSLSDLSDEDWYQFATPGAGYLTVTLDGLSTDANLELYNPSSTWLGDGHLPGIVKERVSRWCWGAERIYAVVLPVAGPTDYSLTVAFAPGDGNDDFATAQVVSLPFAASAEIGHVMDDDFYELSIPGAGRIDVSVTNLSGDADVDLYGDGVHSRLAESHNASVTPESISYDATIAGTYYVRVHPWAPYAVTYDLSISFTP